MYLTYKNVGETPLECLERLRIEYGKGEIIPMTYAGRLDPMAEGLMIVLVGEECKEKDIYTKMDKEYEVEVLFGVFTDSYDLLGMIEKVNLEKVESPDLQKYKGKFIQEYPRYSSKIIAMREKPEIDEMPTKEVEIYQIEQIGSSALSGKRIAEKAIGNIEKVKGDFRQTKIIEEWNRFKEKYSLNMFMIIKLKVACTSGTYMRSLAKNMGGLAFSIKRTRINGYKI